MSDQTNPEQEKDQPQPENVISDYYDSVRQDQMQMAEQGIKKARTALFVVAGLMLLGEIISASASNIVLTPLAIGIIIAEVGIFVGLAMWTKSKPYSAIITGLVVFIGLWILAIAMLGMRAAYGGIVVRIIIIVTLVNAMKPAKAWEDAKKG